jgi:release factor glutamine methyltransferase
MPVAETLTPAARSAQEATVANARQSLAQLFHNGGLDTPNADARILIGHALGLNHTALAAAGDRCVSAKESEMIAALAQRRLCREPVARIVGCKEFWSLPLAVNASTLVPRPETETVVEVALAAVDASGPRTRALRIADVGTGSGAILLALLSELPNARGVGTDISVEALTMARANAQRLGIDRAAFVAGEMTSPLSAPFDLVVSNPPYVASGDIATLDPEVRAFDPRSALDGGADGLHYYRALSASVPPLLTPGGIVVVEIGAGQATAVTQLLSTAGLAVAAPHHDLNGVPRALLASKASNGP